MGASCYGSTSKATEAAPCQDGSGACLHDPRFIKPGSLAATEISGSMAFGLAQPTLMANTGRQLMQIWMKLCGGMKLMKGNAVAATIIVTAVASVLGYTCATAYLTCRDYGYTAAVDWTWLALSYFPVRTVRPDDFWLATMIIGGFACVGLIFVAASVRRSRYEG